METDNLLDEFPPVSTQAWEDAIHADLKSADYAKKLIWQTPEGLAAKPYYRAEDIADLALAGDVPGIFPYTRGTRATAGWLIREEIDAVDAVEANHAAVSAVAAGAEEISFLNVILRRASDLKLLFANLGAIPVHFENAGEPLLRLLLERAKNWSDLRPLSTGWRPLEDLDFAASVTNSAPHQFVPFTLNGTQLEECGATAVEELGILLAAGIEFLREMTSRNVKIDRAASSVAFSFSIGSSFFFQIAKFRAFRRIWARAVESFGGDQANARARISARTSRWNKTIYDPHVNILRATTETLSAILGGVDSICVGPYDECFRQPDQASRRLARNTQLILKREALLARVADPGAGSYCIEVFTDFLAREGWKWMQKIEATGGYRKACASGIIDRILQERLTALEKAVVMRRRVFTGTNKYADPAEKAFARIEPLQAMDRRRGAQVYERLRLRTELHSRANRTPRILLAEFGDAKMRAARSNFAANFIACAGFEIATRRFESADEIASCDTDLIVLCSSDAEYLAMARELGQKLRAIERATPVVVAGNPESADELRAAGVYDFIHIRSNPIAVLTEWQRRFGIRD